MAAVLSDFVSDSSRFHSSHTMIAGSGQQRASSDSSYRQRSGSRAEAPPSPPRPNPVTSTSASSTASNSSARTVVQIPAGGDGATEGTVQVNAEPPSPPNSTDTDTPQSRQRFTSQEHFSQDVPYQQRSPESSPSDARPTIITSPSDPAYTPITRAARSLDDVKKYGGNTIKVRDLAHIQSFATDEFLSYRGQSGRRRTADDPTLKYEISGMPITDIIEMVAGLLTKITTTNDHQHESLHRPLLPTETMNMSGLSSSVLAFHGKNVPSITILSYLSRIHKYCPTTYEVFLSLLVYFDRMTERVNAAPLQALSRDHDQENSRPSSGYSLEGSDLADSPPASSRSVPEINSDLERAQYTHAPSDHSQNSPTTFPLSHFFVVDSFNIHRLVIAGVTCASKFFSDVFYTNSRYAKVSLKPGMMFLHFLTNILGWRFASSRT